jgi:hypothetical protein
VAEASAAKSQSSDVRAGQLPMSRVLVQVPVTGQNGVLGSMHDRSSWIFGDPNVPNQFVPSQGFTPNLRVQLGSKTCLFALISRVSLL